MQTLNEEKIRAIVSESLKKYLAENCEEEGFLGGLFDKRQRALKLYASYRDLLTKLNQAKTVLNTKSANAFGTNKKNAYQAAIQYGQNGYGKQQPQPQGQLSEEVDETLGRGIQSVFNNTVNNIKTKPIANIFQGTASAFNKGDATGDANNYKDLWNKCNAQLKAFKEYCAANNIVPEEIVKMYDQNERYDVLHGNTDRIKERHSKQDSTINGKSSGTGNIEQFGQGGVSFRPQRQELGQMARDINHPVFHAVSEEKMNEIISESIKKILTKTEK